MFKRSFKLCRTHRLPSTIQDRSFLNRMGLANRTCRRRSKLWAACFARYRYTFHNVGNHIPRPFNFHCISDTHVFPGHFLHVMERRPADRHAPNLDRIQQGNGRQRSGSSDRHGNALYGCQFFARRKLIGDGPARTPGFHSKGFLPLERIDFNHDAVNLERQGIPLIEHLAVECQRLLDRPAMPTILRNG